MAHKGPVFITVPRKLIIAWVVVSLVLFIGNILSIQYTNWVDRRSNRYVCELVTFPDEIYKEVPPNTPTGKKMADGYDRARKGPICK